MATKLRNAFVILSVAALLFANGDAQGEQNCDSGPAPPRDLEAFVWVNSGFDKRFSANDDAARERLRADFLCQKVVDRLVTGFSANVPILETDFGTACSIPLASSCNLLSSCPAGEDIIVGRRRLTQCVPYFGCSFNTAGAGATFQEPDGESVSPPPSRISKIPTTTVGICFLGSCTVLGVDSSSNVFGALAYKQCPEVYANTIVDGWNPLHWMASIATTAAIASEIAPTINALIENGASLDTQDAQGFTPLHLASELGVLNAVQPFLNAGADVEAKDNFGNTPLAVASNFGKDSVVQALLKAGANPNVKYSEAPGSPSPGGGNFKTPLHFVALYGLGPLKELIEAGADVNAVDSDGNTPLRLAVRFKRLNTINVLRQARRQARVGR